MGGSIGLTGNGNSIGSPGNSSDPGARQYNINLNPEVGYFVTDRLAIGLSPSWSYTVIARENQGQLIYMRNRNSNYRVEIFARYYVPIGEKWSAFGTFSGPGYSYGRGKYESRLNAGDPIVEATGRTNTYTLGAYVGFGITYFVIPKIGIESTFGAIGYGFNWSKQRGEVPAGGTQEVVMRSNGGGLSFNPNTFTLGLRFYLSNAKE